MFQSYNAVVTTDSSGAGSFSLDVGGPRRLVAVYAGRSDLAATADITVASSYLGAENNYLSVADTATDVWYHPVVQSVASTGAAVTGQYQSPFVMGTITVSIAQGGDAKTGEFILVFEV